MLTMPPGPPSRQVGKSIILPLLCLCRGENDLLYLNHIIIAHYNASYGCRKCLKQAFVSSSALHNHKKVCIGFITKKSAAGSDGKPSSSRGGDGSHGSSTKATSKKDSKAPATDSQGSSTSPASQTSPHPVDERLPTTTSPTRTQRTCQVTRRRRRRMRAPPGRAPATRHTRTVATTRPMSALSAAVLPISLYFVNKIFHCKACVSVMI